MDKIGKKIQEKEAERKNEQENEKRRSFEDLDKELADTKEKHKNIEILCARLKNNYEAGGQALGRYKGDRKELEDVYEKAKEILAEEGINSFEEMLAANENEPEVRVYHEKGARYQNKETGAWKTGRLYSQVEQLVQTAEELKSLLPELKLNFSNTKARGQEISNRENAFIKISEYLKELEQKIQSLEQQRDRAYLETPEGQKEAILKIRHPESDLRDVDLAHLESFHFNHGILRLSQEIGAGSIKELYTESLAKRLEGEIFERKSKPGGYQSQEQMAIKEYPDLEKLANLNYSQEYVKTQEAYNAALNHLEKIFSNEEVGREISHYGISGGVPEASQYRDEQIKYSGWSNPRVQADRYLNHISGLGNIVPGPGTSSSSYEYFLSVFKSSKEAANSRNFQSHAYSSEFFKTAFQNYQKFFDYIVNKTDEKTVFVGDAGKNKGEVLENIKNNDFRKDIGIVEDADFPEKRIPVPSHFISSCGGFDNAWQKSIEENRKWQEQKKAIEEISRTLVDLRWSQDYNFYLRNENRNFLEKYAADKQYLATVNFTLEREGQFLTEEFQGRLVRSEQNYNRSSNLFDVTAQKAREEYYRQMSQLREEIKAYVEERKSEIDKDIVKIEKAFLTSRGTKEERKKPFFERKRLLTEYDPGSNKYSWDWLKTRISEDEISKLREFEDKAKGYKDIMGKVEKESKDFYEVFNKHRFPLEIIKGDPLLDREMSVAELFAGLKKKQEELTGIINGLTPEQKKIVEEKERTEEEIEVKQKKYTEAMRENVGKLK